MLHRRDAISILILSAALLGIYDGALEQSIWSSDDWFHMNAAQGLLGLEREAWRLPFMGDEAPDALRVTPYLFFVLDWAVHGAAASGYYATNLFLAWTCLVAVFFLLRAFSVSPLVASLATGCFVLLAPMHQIIYWVSARDDGVAVAAGLLTLVAWTHWRERTSRRWICVVLYALACFAKPPMGIQVLVLLFLLEFLLPQATAGANRLPLRRLLPFVAVAGAWCILLTLLIWGRSLGGDMLGVAPPTLIARRFSALLLPSYPYGGPVHILETVIMACACTGAGLLAFRHPAGSRPLVGFGVGLILAGIVPLLPWLLASDPGAATHARYLLLASAGVPFLGAGLFATDRDGGLSWLRRSIGCILLGCLVVSGGSMAQASLERQQSSSDGLIRLLESIDQAPSAAAPPLYIGIRQPDGGTTSLLASPLWTVLFPDFKDTRVFLQGNKRLYRRSDDRFGYGQLSATDQTVDVRFLPPGALLVWQEPTPDGLAWTLSPRPPQWVESTQWVTKRINWSKPNRREYREGTIYREIQTMGLRLDPLPLPADIRESCVVEFVLSPAATLVEERRVAEEALLRVPFSLVSFGTDRDAVLVPIEPSTRAATLFLPNVAGARPSNNRLRLKASNVPGSAGIDEIRLLGRCQPYPSSEEPDRGRGQQHK